MSYGSLLSIRKAATILDASPNAVRQRIKRAKRVDADGVHRADLDAGVRAIKLHGSWRLLIPDALRSSALH